MINKCSNCRTNEYMCSKCVLGNYKDILEAISIITISLLIILFMFLLSLHWCSFWDSIAYTLFSVLILTIVILQMSVEAFFLYNKEKKRITPRPKFVISLTRKAII